MASDTALVEVWEDDSKPGSVELVSSAPRGLVDTTGDAVRIRIELDEPSAWALIGEMLAILVRK